MPHTHEAAVNAKNIYVPMLQRGLESFMRVFNTRMGNVQILDVGGKHAALSIAAQEGFREPFLTAFATVEANHGTGCGRALRTGKTVVIADVETDEEYAPYRDLARDAGYRAVVSTPIRTKWGHNVGIVSTHFESPGAPAPDRIAIGEAIARELAHDIVRAMGPDDITRGSW